jgi:hypothetical protein
MFVALLYVGFISWVKFIDACVYYYQVDVPTRLSVEAPHRLNHDFI